MCVFVFNSRSTSGIASRCRHPSQRPPPHVHERAKLLLAGSFLRMFPPPLTDGNSLFLLARDLGADGSELRGQRDSSTLPQGWPGCQPSRPWCLWSRSSSSYTRTPSPPPSFHCSSSPLLFSEGTGGGSGLFTLARVEGFSIDWLPLRESRLAVTATKSTGKGTKLSLSFITRASNVLRQRIT